MRRKNIRHSTESFQFYILHLFVNSFSFFFVQRNSSWAVTFCYCYLLSYLEKENIYVVYILHNSEQLNIFLIVTIMKFAAITFVLLTLFLTKGLALDAENYIAFIEDLSHDEKFLEEYAKWSSQLFSQSGYLYGDSHTKFPCSVDKSDDDDEDDSIPTSVHSLRPNDIKCIGAMGDSFTTGLGAHGITPINLLYEDRGEII
jgi:hypothetical protein